MPGGAPLPFYSRYTFRRHLPSAACEGVLYGLLMGLADIVLTKGLHASAGYVTALAMVFPVSLLLSSVFAGLMLGREKRGFFLAAGVLGRLPLVLVALVDSPLPFVALMFLVAASQSITVTAQNSIIQANYPAEARSRIFARVQVFSSAASILAALTAGLILEANEAAYKAIYPVAGALGFLSTVLLSRIKVRGARRRFKAGVARAPLRLGGALREAVQAAVDGMRILREEPLFRRFEAGFFLYGMAFMCMQPIIPIYLTRTLEASYVEAALAKQGAFGLATLLALPFMGRLLDRRGPIRASARIFAVLALFPLTLAAARDMGVAYAAFALYGIAMAGVHLIWNLSSIHFARDRDSGPFQGVHVTLVGLRGMLAPLLGYAALELGRPRLGMFLSSGLLVAAVAVMVRLRREDEEAAPGKRGP